MESLSLEVEDLKAREQEAEISMEEERAVWREQMDQVAADLKAEVRG